MMNLLYICDMANKYRQLTSLLLFYIFCNSAFRILFKNKDKQIILIKDMYQSFVWNAWYTSSVICILHVNEEIHCILATNCQLALTVNVT